MTNTGNYHKNGTSWKIHIVEIKIITSMVNYSKS